MRKLLAVLAVLALAPFALAACGGDDDGGGNGGGEPTGGGAGGGGAGDGGAGGGGSTSLSLTASETELAYDTDSLEASAGSVTIALDNPSSTGHDVCLESPEGEDVGCSDTVAGDTTEVNAEVESGDYTFYCSVDGHRDAGMEGTLTVE